MDVLVLDMNWHIKPAWGAYTFDKNLFPFPSETLELLHNSGLKVSCNLHDNCGITNKEEKFVDMCKALGYDVNKTTEIKFSNVD
jgi:alpha-glucosidase (family GH31 glycosyl hydrolase)